MISSYVINFSQNITPQAAINLWGVCLNKHLVIKLMDEEETIFDAYDGNFHVTVRLVDHRTQQIWLERTGLTINTDLYSDVSLENREADLRLYFKGTLQLISVQQGDLFVDLDTKIIFVWENGQLFLNNQWDWAGEWAFLLELIHIPYEIRDTEKGA